MTRVADAARNRALSVKPMLKEREIEMKGGYPKKECRETNYSREMIDSRNERGSQTVNRAKKNEKRRKPYDP